MLPFLEHKNTDLFLNSYRNFSFPAHFHSGLEIIYAIKGPITLAIEGRDYPVGEGDVGIVLPGQIHSYQTAAGIENEGRIILLGQRLLGEYGSELSGKSLTRPVLALKSLHSHCALAIQTLIELEGGELNLQKAYSRLFLCRFMQAAEFTGEEKIDDPLLYSLIRYMSGHFRENVSLSDAADALYVSKYHLSRIFSGAMKMNFNDYLNSLRVNAAVQLLDSTDMPVTKIAYEVGFGNVRTFNRAFLKHMGVSPRDYRKEKT